ncbi:hypothetical protein ACOMHN_064147 [Nucella lapillus]
MRRPSRRPPPPLHPPVSTSGCPKTTLKHLLSSSTSFHDRLLRAHIAPLFRSLWSQSNIGPSVIAALSCLQLFGAFVPDQPVKVRNK